jgi:hypothetical protein
MRRALGVALSGGGMAGALTILLPFTALHASRLAEYAGLAVGLVAVHLAMRATRGTPFRARLAAALLVATVVSACVGGASYLLFRGIEPGLLAARYERAQLELQSSGAAPARIDAEMSRLDARKASYLDPAFMAISSAGALFFFAVLLAGFAAFRTYVAERLAPRPRSERQQP